MGHDGHFLSRLDRVNRDQTDFALSLYRDHQMVRWVLDRAKIPEQAERVAIALTDGPDAPHLIVARDGGFVTCLGAGMSIGDRPRVRRSELNRLIDQSREFRQRWAVLREESSLKWFFRRLVACGPRIAREDFLPFVQIAPVLEHAYLKFFLERVEHLEKRLRFVVDELARDRPDEESLHQFWLDYYLVEHLMVLVGESPRLMCEFLQFGAENGSRPASLFWGLARFGTTAALARVSWASGRVGSFLNRDVQDLTLRTSLPQTMTGWACCMGLVLAGELEVDNPTIASLLDLPNPEKKTAIEAWRRLMQLEVATSRRAEHLAFRREKAFHAARDRWVLSVPDGAAELLRDTDADTEKLACAVVGSCSMNLLEAFSTGFVELALGAPHLVHGARAEMFYPPRAWLDALVKPWSLEAMRRLVDLAQLEVPLVETVRNAASVGRNDPCPCGSGKKFKKCCGR